MGTPSKIDFRGEEMVDGIIRPEAKDERSSAVKWFAVSSRIP